MSQHATSDPSNTEPHRPEPGHPAPRHETPAAAPSSADVKRWRQYLADERAEAAVYRDLAQNRSGEERAILLALAEAEGRHEAHWLQLLGDHAGRPRPASLRSQLLGFLARHFGSVFVLALAQRAESRSPYATDPSATPAMVADEQIHEEVVRGLATRGRNRLAGTFRAAVFGAGVQADAFNTAFRIGSLFRELFAEGSLSSAFVPLYADVEEKEGAQSAFALANAFLEPVRAAPGGSVVDGAYQALARYVMEGDRVYDDMVADRALMAMGDAAGLRDAVRATSDVQSLSQLMRWTADRIAG